MSFRKIFQNPSKNMSYKCNTQKQYLKNPWKLKIKCFKGNRKLKDKVEKISQKLD